MSEETLTQEEPKFSTVANQTEEQTVVGYGQMLSAAREAKGLTIEQVASQLRLTPKQIALMEAQDANAFPTAVYARAHLRGYARLMGLDAAKIVELFNQSIGSEEKDLAQHISKTTEGLAPFKQEKSKHGKGRGLVYLVFVLIVAAVAAVGWYYYNDYKTTQKAQQEAAEQVILNKQRLEAEEKEKEQAKLEQARLEAEQKAKAEKEALQRLLEESSKPLTAAVNAAGTVEVLLPNVGNSEVKIMLSIDSRPQSARSWIGVYNAEGRPVFNKTLAAGQSEEFIGTLPLRFSFGDAAVAGVVINDRTVEFREVFDKNKTRHFVAKLKE